MFKRSFFRSVLPFLPLLVLYILVIVVFSSDELVFDESRHMTYATNLINGFYTDIENPELRNGPGYPLVISFLVLCKTPYIFIKLLNAIFLLSAVIFFYKAFLFYISPRRAIALGYVLGLYPASLKWMIFIHSEAFAIFLACGFLYYFIKLNKQASKHYFNAALSGLFLGFLALTKVIFGYVILCAILFYLMLYILKRSKKTKYNLFVIVGSLVLCTPYLFYTYSLTGKSFLWGTGGGEMLYWRSSPFPNEYGDWISSDVVLGNRKQNYSDSRISKNHGPFIQSLEPHSYVQRDSLYKLKALENMRQYPIKYIQNTGASALRLFFNYPHSYTPQKISTYAYIIPNMFLVLFLLSSSYLAIRKFAAIPFEIRFIGLMALLFVGALILLNGKVRHLLPILPLLLFFIVFVHDKIISIETKV